MDKGKRRKIVWKKTGGVCAHCGKKKYGEQQQTIDHVTPKSWGGGYDLDNLLPLCKECNQAKSNYDVGNLFTYYKFAPKQEVYKALRYKLRFEKRERKVA